METYPVGIDDFNLADFVAAGFRAFVALKTKFDVLGGEGIAIVKFETLAQFELIHLLVARSRVHDSARRGAMGLPGMGLSSASCKA